MKNIRSIFNCCLSIALSLFVFSSCESEWDEHNKINDKTRGESLMKVLSENAETSKFVEILEKTGYDTLLSGDKMITVFAPNNNALASVDMENGEALKTLVKNHLAYGSYTLINGSFTSGKVEMFNGKYVLAQGAQLNGVGVESGEGKSNVSAANGILHIVGATIPLQMNIWEYLQAQSGNWQAEYIGKLERKVMDMERSVQTGINENSQPIYDTAWIDMNPFLEAYPINDETQNYTYALLPNEVVQRIETKYAKYFASTEQTVQDSLVRWELITDCILAPVVISGDSRYASVDGILVDISAADILESYTASNGLVYKLRNADVKVYENKVKTIFIEAEDYTEYFADGTAWQLRSRPGILSGGKDMMMNAQTTFKVKQYDAELDTAIIANTYTNIHCYQDKGTNLQGASGTRAKVNNCYIQFNPVINSVPYKLYWAAYDDIFWHYGTDYVEPVKFSQKMLISLPDQPVLYRGSDAKIYNNFSRTSTFASTRFTANIYEEKQLTRYLLSENITNAEYFVLRENVRSKGEEDYYVRFTENDDLGDEETIINPTYGEATVFVANTSETTGNNSGMIFLDYIKLVPVVDPNE